MNLDNDILEFNYNNEGKEEKYIGIIFDGFILSGKNLKEPEVKKEEPKVEVKEEKVTPVVTEEEIIKNDFTFNTKASELQKIKDERKQIEKEEKTTVEPKAVKHTSLLGINLPPSKEDKPKRRRIYRREALTFALIFPIIDLFIMLFFKKYTYLMFTNNPTVNYIVTLIIDFVLVFCVTYLFDYIFSEDSIKKSK